MKARSSSIELSISFSTLNAARQGLLVVDTLPHQAIGSWQARSSNYSFKNAQLRN